MFAGPSGNADTLANGDYRKDCVLAGSPVDVHKISISGYPSDTSDSRRAEQL